MRGSLWVERVDVDCADVCVGVGVGVGEGVGVYEGPYY